MKTPILATATLVGRRVGENYMTGRYWLKREERGVVVAAVRPWEISVSVQGKTRYFYPCMNGWNYGRAISPVGVVFQG